MTSGRRRKFLICGLLLGVVALLFPPWIKVQDQKIDKYGNPIYNYNSSHREVSKVIEREYTEFGFVFSQNLAQKINWSVLILEFCVIALLTTLLALFFEGRSFDRAKFVFKNLVEKSQTPSILILELIILISIAVVTKYSSILISGKLGHNLKHSKQVVTQPAGVVKPKSTSSYIPRISRNWTDEYTVGNKRRQANRMNYERTEDKGAVYYRKSPAPLQLPWHEAKLPFDQPVSDAQQRANRDAYNEQNAAWKKGKSVVKDTLLHLEIPQQRITIPKQMPLKSPISLQRDSMRSR